MGDFKHSQKHSSCRGLNEMCPKYTSLDRKRKAFKMRFMASQPYFRLKRLYRTIYKNAEGQTECTVSQDAH